MDKFYILWTIGAVIVVMGALAVLRLVWEMYFMEIDDGK